MVSQSVEFNKDERILNEIADIVNERNKFQKDLMIITSELVKERDKVKELEKKINDMVGLGDYAELKCYKIAVDKYLKDLNDENSGLNDKIAKIVKDMKSTSVSISKAELLVNLKDEQMRNRAEAANIKGYLEDAFREKNQGFKNGKKPKAETDDYDFVGIIF